VGFGGLSSGGVHKPMDESRELHRKGVQQPMDESRELHRKIARCRRSLLIISDPGSIRALHGMIETAERRLTEIEHEEPAILGQGAS
jgi:hypothetical protein